MLCPYCKHKIEGKRHQNQCPYNPINSKRIVEFLKYYVLTFSKYNKGFCPFPTTKELDAFCKANNISRVKTIKRYLDEISLNDWLTEILDYALTYKIIDESDFPYFLQFIYDNWLFKRSGEYRALYEQAILYEDGDQIEKDVGLGDERERLREAGTPFVEKKVLLKSVLTG